jgi:UPF0755 protein
LVLGLLAVLAVAALGAGAWWAWQTLHEPYRGWSGDETLVRIEPGTAATDILHRLQAEGVLVDADLARLYLVHYLQDPPLLAGEYRFDEALNTPQVLEKLTSGDVVTHGVTVIEGLTLWETAALLAREGFGDEQAFVDAMSSPRLIADLDPDATNLEGYLFPSTYRFPSNATEATIVETLVRTFRNTYQREVEPLIPPPEPGEEAATVRDIVTLASIVEKEARLDEERPTIAGVYAHRLRRGIGLYADPTVIYALRLAGRWDGNIRRGDLQIESPYNTYVVQGLPPGPVASPGRLSLEAAAAPPDVPYLYFVSRNDGSHVFSETLAEHNRNVERWQKQYWREKWAEERRRGSEPPAEKAAPPKESAPSPPPR